MRILFWQTRFRPDVGGAEVLGGHLVRALVSRGHEVLVIASHVATLGEALADEYDFHGVPVVRYPFLAALQCRDVPAITDLRRRVDERARDFGPDVVHVNSQDSDLFFLHRSVALARVPWLFTIHSSATFTEGANSLLGRTVSGAASIACVSRAMRDDVVRFSPVAEDRVAVVRNALPDDGTSVRPFPLVPSLLTFGRLVPEKGFDLAIEACARLGGAARLVVAGDGPARSALERLAVDRDLSERVRFTGWVAPEDVGTLIDPSTIVLVPSRWREPFGLVALQAAQRGRPVVASNVGGLPEIVADGETGLLVEPSATAFACAIERLLGDSAERDRMGLAARARAVSAFRFDRFVDAYEDLYRSLARS